VRAVSGTPPVVRPPAAVSAVRRGRTGPGHALLRPGRRAPQARTTSGHEQEAQAVRDVGRRLLLARLIGRDSRRASASAALPRGSAQATACGASAAAGPAVPGPWRDASAAAAAVRLANRACTADTHDDRAGLGESAYGQRTASVTDLSSAAAAISRVSAVTERTGRDACNPARDTRAPLGLHEPQRTGGRAHQAPGYDRSEVRLC
jgi:hypothetical protein